MKQGNIVMIPFPFSNHRSSKVRPAIVLSNESLGGDDIILMGMTSRKPKVNSLLVDVSDLCEGTLPLKSFVQLHKVAYFEESMVRQIIGSLSKKKLEEIVQAFQKLVTVQ